MPVKAGAGSRQSPEPEVPSRSVTGVAVTQEIDPSPAISYGIHYQEVRSETDVIFDPRH